MSAYLFILCPPYSGSTLLWKLVSTSPAVSSLPSEGQFLPEVRTVMRHNPWDSATRLRWPRIKEVWDSYWDYNKPLLIEKSPPHIIRTDQIRRHFSPIHFLLMVRNPYAHCEGLMRRNAWSPETAAEFAVRCLRQQAKNADRLPAALAFKYEELAGNPGRISRRITTFLPVLGDLKHARSFKVHSIDGYLERGIADLNHKKIHNLSPSSIKRINAILEKHPDVMARWNYAYREASMQHARAFLKTRSHFFLSATSARLSRLAAKVTKQLDRINRRCG